MVETESTGNLKATRTFENRDWTRAQRCDFLCRGTQIKVIWIPCDE